VSGTFCSKLSASTSLVSSAASLSISIDSCGIVVLGMLSSFLVISSLDISSTDDFFIVSTTSVSVDVILMLSICSSLI
jgi:hypothetical protein